MIRPRRPLLPAVVLSSLLLPLHGCGEAHTAGGATPTWTRATAELSEAQRTQQQKALQARDTLAKTLLGELTGAMQEGPVHAIEVCEKRAPAIAAEVGSQQGVRIGRTAVKLRSKKNVPPQWAAEHVRGAQSPATFVGPDGQLGALFPIKLQAQCLVCHGKTDIIGPDVRGALQMRYPDDQATGFAIGDLRGWFWVEVPKAE
ncbi:MAG: DUF3365 domain-containing protein [Planctomycetota bacterium]